MFPIANEVFFVDLDRLDVLDGSLRNGHNWLSEPNTTHGRVDVLEVPEGVVWYLHVPCDEVLADARFESE